MSLFHSPITISANSSPKLRICRRLHLHSTLAQCKGMPISVVIPVSRPLKALYHSFIHGRSFQICNWLVESCITEHFLYLRYSCLHAPCLARVCFADCNCKIEIVLRSTRMFICLSERVADWPYSKTTKWAQYKRPLT